MCYFGILNNTLYITFYYIVLFYILYPLYPEVVPDSGKKEEVCYFEFLLFIIYSNMQKFRKNSKINFPYFISVLLHQSENIENILHFSLKEILLCPSIQSFIQALAGGSKAEGI